MALDGQWDLKRLHERLRRCAKGQTSHSLPVRSSESVADEGRTCLPTPVL